MSDSNGRVSELTFKVFTTCFSLDCSISNTSQGCHLGLLWLCNCCCNFTSRNPSMAPNATSTGRLPAPLLDRLSHCCHRTALLRHSNHLPGSRVDIQSERRLQARNQSKQSFTRCEPISGDQLGLPGTFMDDDFPHQVWLLVAFQTTGRPCAASLQVLEGYVGGHRPGRRIRNLRRFHCLPQTRA